MPRAVIAGLKSVVLGGVIALCLGSAAVPVSAESNSLGVRPRTDYVIKPGATVTDTFTINNLSKTEALKVDISVIDFGARDESGSPSLLLDQKEPTRWSLKPYVKLPATATIPAGKSSDIPITIFIPGNVGAGSYYGAVRYASAGATPTQNVTLASSTATLLFVRVPGQADEALILKSFGAFTPDKTGEKGTFANYYGGKPPKFLAYRLQNKGNIASRPTGSVAITGLFGKKVQTIENVNPNDSLILIEQTRRFDICLNEEKISRTDPETGRNVRESKCNDPDLAPGRYTAQLALIYGENGSAQHELRKTVSFWYLPMWSIIVAIAVVVVLVVLIILVVKLLTRRTKRKRR